jgi:hypothetical protein
MPRVALIYPPGGDPRAPRLPLPALAAALRPAGVDVSLFDLDIDGVLDLLRPQRLLESGERVARKALQAGGSRRRQLERISYRATELAEAVPAALKIIRDPDQFCDPVRLNSARERLYDALDLASLAADRNLRYQIEILRYDVEGIDPTVSRALERGVFPHSGARELRSRRHLAHAALANYPRPFPGEATAPQGLSRDPRWYSYRQSLPSTGASAGLLLRLCRCGCYPRRRNGAARIGQSAPVGARSQQGTKPALPE